MQLHFQYFDEIKKHYTDSAVILIAYHMKKYAKKMQKKRAKQAAAKAAKKGKGKFGKVKTAAKATTAVSAMK